MMALPAFNEHGDMPVGVHPATIDEICARFTGATAERQAATKNLRRICDLARSTRKLQRFIVFGSYITAKPAPNDVDVVLLMCDDFLWEACAGDVHALFDHQLAPEKFGASIFWTRPGAILGESIENFIAGWQVKRDRTRRGIVEVTA
jgi:hypothetical protein